MRKPKHSTDRAHKLFRLACAISGDGEKYPRRTFTAKQDRKALRALHLSHRAHDTARKLDWILDDREPLEDVLSRSDAFR